MKNWIQAARLRTLPLSISGIIVGSSCAFFEGYSNIWVLILALITTLGLQILSNFANDYGDGVKGTDANRIGEKRLVGSGVISPEKMKKAVIITAIITFSVALLLIFVSFGMKDFFNVLVFIILGIFAIVAAIKYTVGKKAYGYSGLGDVFVFIFFGWVAVMGSYFLYTKELNWTILLPGTGIGVLSVAVLNLNNMRDHVNDELSRKITLVVKMGLSTAKKYHYFLFAIFTVCMAIFFKLNNLSYIPLILINFLFVKHLITVFKAQKYEDFDPELKKVALGTFLFSVLFTISVFLE